MRSGNFWRKLAGADLYKTMFLLWGCVITGDFPKEMP